MSEDDCGFRAFLGGSRGDGPSWTTWGKGIDGETQIEEKVLSFINRKMHSGQAVPLKKSI